MMISEQFAPKMLQATEKDRPNLGQSASRLTEICLMDRCFRAFLQMLHFGTVGLKLKSRLQQWFPS
jgi:hypothetical protein